jgi:hypothetical protein
LNERVLIVRDCENWFGARFSTICGRLKSKWYNILIFASSDQENIDIVLRFLFGVSAESIHDADIMCRRVLYTFLLLNRPISSEPSENHDSISLAISLNVGYTHPVSFESVFLRAATNTNC